MTMPTPTDIRAALRDAANALARIGLRRDAELIASLRAIADAPPTVAELLPLVDATHRVEFADGCGDERRIVRSETGGLSLLGCYGPGGEWLPSDLLIEDLHRPAKLVEVAP